MGKFYATGYTNGGSNEKRIGPFKTLEEALKAGRAEQGKRHGFTFAGVVGEDGTYVYHNARNAVAPELRRATKLRLKENFSDEYGSYRKGDVFQVYTYQFSPHHAILVAPGREVTLEVPWDKVEVANACRNSVVANALNACGTARNASFKVIPAKDGNKLNDFIEYSYVDADEKVQKGSIPYVRKDLLKGYIEKDMARLKNRLSSLDKHLEELAAL